MKESVTKFDLEAAFKALDELDIPVAKKGIAANRVNLKETFNRKLKTDALIEEYYDVNSSEDLDKASEDRQAEVAQAKLARIEKIVDLDAETEEDILPSYEGKVIVQCPQCMTLFYKNPEDVEASEDDDTVVNVGEVCQHCGNESGYTVIGKVAAIEPETEEESADLDLNLEEPTEEETTTNEENQELELAPIEEEPEEEPEEKKEEALNTSTKTVLTEDTEEEKVENTEDIVEEDPTEEDIEAEATIEDSVEDPENKDALEVLKNKIDVHGEEDTITIAEKGQLDNEEAPKIEVEVSEEEFDTLEKEFHDDEVEETETEIKVDDEITDDKITSATNEKLAKYNINENLSLNDDAELRKLFAKLSNAQLVDFNNKHWAETTTYEDGKFNLYERNSDKPYNSMTRKEFENLILDTIWEAYNNINSYDELIKAIANDLGLEISDIIKQKPEKVLSNNVPVTEAAQNNNSIKNIKEALSDNMDRFEMQEFLEDRLGKDETLEALVRAMSEDQMKDLFDYIVRMYDLENEDLNEAKQNNTLNEDGIDGFKELMNSDEFKTPISEKEVDLYLKDSLDEQQNITLDDIEEIDEEAACNKITESLKAVYENVKDFKLENVAINNKNEFILEGTINFNSGNNKKSSYVFTESKISNNKLILSGYNNELDSNGNFYLNCNLDNKNKLIVESVNYSYHVNGTLVEKLN